MPQCVNHPDRYATYDTPNHFCDVCWEMWVTEGYTFVKREELIEIRKVGLRSVWSDFKSPGEEIEKLMLIEIEHLTNLEYKGLRGTYRLFSRFFNQVRIALTNF
jgi:hypothetical protein